MLTEEQYKEIEKAIGVTGLQEMIESQDSVDLVLTKTKHFTETEHRQLVNNVLNEIPSEKYEEAKIAGEEIKVKSVKRAKGLEFEGKSVDALVEYYEKQISLNKETNESEIKKQYESDIAQIRKALQEKENVIDNLNSRFKMAEINRPIDSYFDSLPIEVPAHIKNEEQAKAYIETERKRHKVFFKSQNKMDIDEHGNIVTLDENDKVLKDNSTLQPIHIDNRLKEYTENSFVNVKQVLKGRGESDRLPGNNLADIKTMDELNEYAAKKGIDQYTSEMDALVIEFNKNK